MLGSCDVLLTPHYTIDRSNRQGAGSPSGEGGREGKTSRFKSRRRFEHQPMVGVKRSPAIPNPKRKTERSIAPEPLASAMRLVSFRGARELRGC